MGFQSSFNQLLGTVSGVALGYKHIKGQKEANETALRNEKIAAGEEYQREYNSGMELANDIRSHNKQLDSINKGIDALNEQAKQGKMSRKAYEKAFQAQMEQGGMLFDQNQELIARKKILEERMNANAETMIKHGYGKSPVPIIPDIEDMAKAKPSHLNEDEAKWRNPGRPKKEVK